VINTVDAAMSTAPDYAAQDLASLARWSDVPIREDVLQELVRLLLHEKPVEPVVEVIQSITSKTTAG
jgi:hypothetical protein